MNFVPMTQEGFTALQEELKNLKSVVRIQVIRDIEEARSHGDISENAEYDAAKERQAFVEARIRDLEAKVSRVRIVDTTQLSGDKVVFGATVTLLDCESDTKQVWTLVGEEEADLKARKLSITAPLARALVGKSLGDSFEFRSPKGPKEYEIIQVEFR